MSLVRTLASGLRTLLRKDQVERDLDAEIRHYLEMAVLERMGRGSSRADAERLARLELGGVEAVKEEARGGLWEVGVERLGQDARYGARALRRSPGFTIVAIVTLALGIGANTAMFSVLDAVLLRPLPYPESDRLLFLWTDHPRGGVHEEGTSFLTVSDWKSQARAFSDMGMFDEHRVTLTGGVEPEPIEGALVEANTLPLLGVSPAIGRTFTHEELERRERLVVIGHGLWRRRFAGAADVLGKAIEIDGQPSRVIGVMPAGFFFPTRATQIWEPASLAWRYDYFRAHRFRDDWGVIGRLRPGADVREARAEMNAIGRRLELTYPVTEPGFAGFRVSVVPIVIQLAGKNVHLALLVLFGAVWLVLLIACVNVANLMLARGAARGRELALRAALGATRSRLLRQLLTESFLLTAGGWLAGIVVAGAGVRLLTWLALPGIPRLEDVRLDADVLAFALGAGALACLLFGIGPAWTLSRQTPHELLKGGGAGPGRAGTSRTHAALVIAECALAVLLLAGSGLLLRSLLKVQSVDRGFSPQGVVLVRIARAAARVAPPPAVVGSREAMEPKRGLLSPVPPERFYEQLRDRIAGLPGVHAVAGIVGFVNTMNPDWTVAIDGRTPGPGEDSVRVTGTTVTAEFFRAMGVPLRRGRMFTPEDVGSGPSAVAMINETFARRFFPGENPVGRRLTNFGATIIGVVGDIRRQHLENEPVAEFFRLGPMGTDLVVRATGDLATLAPTIREIVRSLDRTASVSSIVPLDQHLDALGAGRRYQTWLLGLFAALALVLSAIGVFAVLQYTVSQRTHEIGIRVSLGAGTGDVLRLVVGQGLRLALLGGVLGLAAASLLTRVMSRLLFGVAPTDPLTFAAAGVVLAAVALLACATPAWRATRVSPLVALKAQ